MYSNMQGKKGVKEGKRDGEERVGKGEGEKGKGWQSGWNVLVGKRDRLKHCCHCRK